MPKEQKAERTHHGRPLPRVRAGSTYLMYGAALVLALCVIGLPVNFALGGDSDSGVTAFLIVGEMFSLILLIIAVFFHRAAKKAIPRILTDDLTKHWTYNPTDWQRFTAQAWRQSIRDTLKLTGFFEGFALVLMLIFFALSQGTFEIITGIAVCTGLVLGLGLLLLLRAFVVWQLRRRRPTSDVYIGWDGVILGGWYYAMRGPRRVTYKAGEPALLRFDVGSGRSRYKLDVPVPHGRESEAEHMALRL